VIVYALMSRATGKAVDLYASHLEAEATLEDALEDEPAWVDVLYVAPVGLSRGSES
jgi:hypothetical protein